MQFCKDIDVLLVFEHITRELETCLSLKLELSRLNISSEIVPLHYNKYETHLRFRPKLVVLPFLNSSNDYTLARIRKIYGDSVIGLNLHHEQLYNEGTKRFMMPKDEYSRCVYHLSWTKSFAKDLEDAGVASQKIRVLRNPRFDSMWLKSSALDFKYIENFDEVIFFPTTFAWAFVPEDYFLKLGNINEETFRRMKMVTTETAREYFVTIRNLAKKYPNKLFMVRPHPYEDVSYFRLKFKEYTGLESIPDNIKIERKGNVYDWIKISSIVIGWCTTTNVEAAVAGKCSLIYHPVNYPDDMKLSFFNDFNILTSAEQLVSIIDGEYRPKISDKTLEKFSEQYGFPLRPVCPSIAAWICDILKSNKVETRLRILPFLKTCTDYIIRDVPKKFLVKTKCLHFLNKNYAGLYEDCVPYKQLAVFFDNFKRSNS